MNVKYGRLGSNKLVQGVCDYLQHTRKSHNKPYPIPVGGSNAIGTWGYINGVNELMEQIEQIRASHDDSNNDDFALDHVIFATGSGGTATGIAVGLSLAYGSIGDGHAALKDQASPPTVHAIGVCDNPDYFYQTMTSIANEMGMTFPNDDCDMTNEEFIRKAVTVHNGKGKGYAFSSQEELDFIVQFATETGIVLDPVYTGKALYYFLNKVVEENPELYRNKNILFWHTGGALGLYEKGDDLLERLRVTSPVKRIDVYGKMEGSGDDVVPIC